MKKTGIIVGLVFFISVFGFYCSYIRRLLHDKPAIDLPRINLLEEVPLGREKEDARVIFVGDVHGQYYEMLELFEKTGMENTTIVFLGDFLAKGPDSVEVADFILDNEDKVKCVLGNHDIAVMFAYLNPAVAKFSWYKNRKNLKPLKFGIGEDYVPDDLKKIKRMHWDISQRLGPKKMAALAQRCSAALHFDFGEKQVYAAHAGMLPGDFNNRVPSIEALTEMKYVDKKDWSKISKEKENKQFIRWYKLWKNSKLPDELLTTSVLYGHDANKGLNIRGHTMGLDTGCVKGGELTGMEFNRIDGKVTTKLYQVRCSGVRRTVLSEMEQKAQNERKNIEKTHEGKSLVSGRDPVILSPSATNGVPGQKR